MRRRRTAPWASGQGERRSDTGDWPSDLRAARQPPATGYSSAVERSILAVLLGTFTLRFSTSLTGTMLIYYLAELPQHGGEEVSSIARRACGAFYAAELVLAPPFGALSDRLGHHRVMQWGRRSVGSPR
jgi:hypothetical protein